MGDQQKEQQTNGRDSGGARARPARSAWSRRLWWEYPVSRWYLLRNRPRARAATALVFATRSGDLMYFTAGRQPTYGELFWSSPQTMYEVDMGRHRRAVTAKLPSLGNTFDFSADILLTWQVIRPIDAVRQNVADPAGDLTLSIIHELRCVSNQHRIDDPAAAEVELNAHLQTRSAKARLLLESDAPIDAAAETEHLPGVAYGVLLTARVALRTNKETVKQRLTTARIDFYRSIIVRGEIEAFVLQIAENPDEASAVIDAIRAEAATHRRETIDFVSRLVDSGAISAYRIEDQVREALEWLKAGTDRVIGKSGAPGGIPQRRRAEATAAPATADLPAADPPDRETGGQR